LRDGPGLLDQCRSKAWQLKSRMSPFSFQIIG